LVPFRACRSRAGQPLVLAVDPAVLVAEELPAAMLVMVPLRASC